jgi:alpha-tubulin suppressor-like RCC1 family protein
VNGVISSGKRRRLLTLTALMMALTVSSSAQAYWTSSGSGSGVSQAGSLGAPSISGITPGAGTAALSWNAVTPPGSGAVTYYVSRGGGNAGGNCPTSSAPSSVLSCTDSGLAAGTYSYTVTAVWRTWTATSSPASSVTLISGALDHFVLSAATTTPTAGAADNLTITAKDAAGITVTAVTGSHSLTFSGAGTVGSFVPTVTNSSGAAISFGTVTAISFTNGVAAVSAGANGVMRLYKAETASITVAEGGSYTSNALSVTVGAGALNSFAIPTPLAQTAGTPFSVSLTAKDAYGNTVTGYTGPKSVVFSGPTKSPGGNVPSYPGSVSFTNGVGSANVTLYNAVSSTITATESGKSGSTGAFDVNAAALDSFTIPGPGTQTAGTQFSLSLTAKDAYSNTATGFTGTQCVAFSGAGASPNTTAPLYPAHGTCAVGQSSVSFSAGVASPGVTLYNAVSTNLTATSSGHSGSTGAFTVNAAGLDSFTVSTPGTQTAGTQFTISNITAKDAWGNTVTGYTGSHPLVFTGAANSPNGTAPIYPASVAFTGGVAASVPIKLFNAASTTLTVTESGKSGSTGAFTVNSTNNEIKLRIIPENTTQAAGDTNDLTIVIGDEYGNPTDYTGTYTLVFNGAATAPDGTRPTVTPNNTTTGTRFTRNIDITFTNGVSQVDAQGRNGRMQLFATETANINVRRSTGTTYQSDNVAVTVLGGPIVNFNVTTPTTRTAGATFNLAVSLTDDFGNTDLGTRCLVFSGPANGPDGTPPSYPAQGSCAAGQSEVTLTGAPTQVPITLYRAAATSITVTDVTSGLARTTGNFTVNPGALDHFSMTAATTTPTAGATDALTIRAFDVAGNAVTSYTGAHNLTFSGASSIRTYNPTVTNNTGNATDFGTATAITFTNGVSSAGGVMTLYQAEVASIVVHDGTHTNGSGLQVTVSPAALSGLSISAEKAVVRPGATDQLTIRAVDTYGNSAPGYSDGPHSLTFSGGTGTRTVTNSSGTQTNFGTATSITFANGISTAGGLLQIGSNQTANIQVTDGAHTSAAFRIVVSSVVATQVSAGAFHTCALRSDGAVECWGEGDSGQLGNGATANSSTPVMVSGLTNATQVSAAKYHTCAVRSDGTVWCWGMNDFGELGNNSTTNSSTPVQVRGVGGTGYLTGVSQVSANGKFTCALVSASQSVVCWGRNQSGQLGIGATDDNTHTTPATVVGVGGVGTLGSVSAITTGANHACALISGGTVDCWGLDDHGQLGNGGAIPGTDSARPTQVVGAGGSGTLSGVDEISGGRMHVCARLDDGTIYCWGRNENGELGDGTTTSRSFPVRSGEITTAVQISAGEYHSCARLQDGTAQCWGAAAYGQIGDGTTADTSTPVTVIGSGGFGVLGGIAEISAGGGDINETDDFEHTVALMNDGTVVSWGQNNYGQLGEGTTTMSIFPAGVALL